MMLTTYSPKLSSQTEFISFWSSQYDYPLEHLYTENIGRPFTAEKVFKLFEWKNGSRLSEKKRESVENNYIKRIPRLAKLTKETSARSFLEEFSTGGAIWRIFWLHCWGPHQFPIYDQHVHRAMVFIEQERIEEIPNNDKKKVDLYLTRYLNFHREFNGEQRAIDKALWFYGKFLKTNRFPIK